MVETAEVRAHAELIFFVPFRGIFDISGVMAREVVRLNQGNTNCGADTLPYDRLVVTE